MLISRRNTTSHWRTMPSEASQESQGESGLSKADFSWEIHQGQRIQPPWWYNKPMQALEAGHLREVLHRSIDTNGIQWYPMVSNGLTVEIDICLPLLASWSSRSDKVQLLLAQSLSESIGSMRIYASMLPCIHAGRWPNATGCALKSWGPGSRKYSSGKFGMRLLT